MILCSTEYGNGFRNNAILMHGREPDESGGPQICRFRNSEKSSSAGSIDQESSNRAALVSAIVASNTAVNAEIEISSYPRHWLISVSATVCYSVSVKTTEILAALDAEIARLQEARNALARLSGAKRRGGLSASALPSKTTRKKGVLSAAARAKIAAAQRKRWAKQRKSA